MTLAEAQKLQVGDFVRLREAAGKVSQITARWFMVTWEGGHPEIITKTRQSILLTRLERVHDDAA